MSDKRAIKPESLEQLRQTVIEEFADATFQEVGIRDICKKAKVSPQTVYKYFGTKEDLLYACVKNDLDAMNARAIAAASSGSSLQQSLAGFVREFFGFYQAHPAIARIVFINIPLLYWVSHESFVQKELHDFLFELIQAAQQRGEIPAIVPADIVLEMAMGAAYRLVARWASASGDETLEQLGEHFLIMLSQWVRPASE